VEELPRLVVRTRAGDVALARVTTALPLTESGSASIKVDDHIPVPLVVVAGREEPVIHFAFEPQMVMVWTRVSGTHRDALEGKYQYPGRDLRLPNLTGIVTVFVAYDDLVVVLINKVTYSSSGRGPSVSGILSPRLGARCPDVVRIGSILTSSSGGCWSR
jgi:hypothetical protein